MSLGDRLIADIGCIEGDRHGVVACTAADRSERLTCHEGQGFKSVADLAKDHFRCFIERELDMQLWLASALDMEVRGR